MKEKISFPILLFMFLTIFEPPFLPVPFIYVQGLIELIYLILFKIIRDKSIKLDIINNSGIGDYVKFLVFLWIWIIVSRLIDVIFFNGMNSLLNLMKTTNQLLVLSFIEFMNIGIIIAYFKKFNNPVFNIFKCVIYTGVFQGILSILAYCIPVLRHLFLKFGGSIYSNLWLLQRRGYGFSLSLLDGFGYGMGIIAALIIFNFKTDNLKSIITQTIQLIIVIISITLNSRTGFIMIFLAIIVKLLFTRSVYTTLLRIPIILVVALILFKLVILFINIGMANNNITIKWIATDFGSMLKSVFPNLDINATASSNYTNNYNPYYNLVTSIELPSGVQYLFGKGWQVYYGSQYGYKSDNGFINLVWMTGILGTIYYFVYNIFINLKALSNKYNIKYYHILIFNIVALLAYSIKGRPFGYYPGIVIFYLIIFSITYFSDTNNKK